MRFRVTLATLAAAAIAAVAVAPAHAAPQSVGTGYIDWGVKQSFRNYISGPIAVGSIQVSNGATKNADGTFRWPINGGSFDLPVEAGEVTSKGTVHFSGHGGILDVMISDLRPVITGDTGILYADVKSRDQDDAQMKEYPNVDLATLDLSAITPVPTAGGFRYEAIPATLTQNGSPAFGGFYDPGEEMDPVTFDAVYGTPAPVFEVPVLKIPAKAQRVKDRQARIARISCPTGPCTTKIAKRTSFEVDGERYRAKVVAPKSIATGKRASVMVKLKRATVTALAGTSAQISVDISATAGDQTATETAQVVIKVPR